MQSIGARGHRRPCKKQCIFSRYRVVYLITQFVGNDDPFKLRLKQSATDTDLRWGRMSNLVYCFLPKNQGVPKKK